MEFLSKPTRHTLVRTVERDAELVDTLNGPVMLHRGDLVMLNHDTGEHVPVRHGDLAAGFIPLDPTAAATFDRLAEGLADAGGGVALVRVPPVRRPPPSPQPTPGQKCARGVCCNAEQGCRHTAPPHRLYCRPCAYRINEFSGPGTVEIPNGLTQVQRALGDPELVYGGEPVPPFQPIVPTTWQTATTDGFDPDAPATSIREVRRAA